MANLSALAIALDAKLDELAAAFEAYQAEAHKRHAEYIQANPRRAPHPIYERCGAFFRNAVGSRHKIGRALGLTLRPTGYSLADVFTPQDEPKE